MLAILGTGTRSSCALKKAAATHPAGSSTSSWKIRHPQAPPASRPGSPGPPRITLHFTSTSGSWLTMAEIFFGIFTRQAIRRGTYRSVTDLTAAIGPFIDGWSERCEPFIWTMTADELLPHCKPGKRNFVYATLGLVTGGGGQRVMADGEYLRRPAGRGSLPAEIHLPRHIASAIASYVHRMR